MKRTKHNPPEQKAKDGPRFIRFSDLQRDFLVEKRIKQAKEWNDALESVYRDLDVMEKIIETPPGTYRLRQNDLSGLDFMPPPPPPPSLTDEEKKAEALKKQAEEKKKADALKKAEEEAKGKKPH